MKLVQTTDRRYVYQQRDGSFLVVDRWEEELDVTCETEEELRELLQSDEDNP